MCAHGVLVSSENKIKAQEDAATSYVGSGNRRDAALTHNRIFVVESETGAAGHERIVAIPECQRINVPKVAGVGRQSLTRHADQLVSVDKNELRVDRIVRLDHAAIPDWSPCSRGEIGESGGACAKEGALSGVGVHGHEIEFLDVPETIEPRAVEGFLAQAIGSCRTARCQGCVGRCAANIRERAHSLQAKTASLESLAERQVRVVAVTV